MTGQRGSPAAPGAGLASPCIGVCRMHEASGWCEGCLRTIDEIVAWGGQDDTARRAVLLALRPRRVVWRRLRADAVNPEDSA